MTESAPLNLSPRIEEWQRALAAGERIELRRPRAKNLLLALVMLGLAIVFALLARASDDGSFIPWFAAVCSFAGFAVFAYRGVAAPPVAIISPAGVSGADHTNPIPWSEIRGTAIVPVARSRFVALMLSPHEHARRAEIGDVTGELTGPDGETMHAALLPNGLPSENDVMALIEIERHLRG